MHLAGCIQYHSKDIDSAEESRTQVGRVESSFACMVECASRLSCRAWVYTKKPSGCQLSTSTAVNFVDAGTTLVISGLRCPGLYYIDAVIFVMTLLSQGQRQRRTFVHISKESVYLGHEMSPLKSVFPLTRMCAGQGRGQRS